MKRYQIAIVLVLALVPLGLGSYRRMHQREQPLVAGVVYWVTPGEKPSFYDFHVKVFATSPDSCYEPSKAKVYYDRGTSQSSAVITVQPQIVKYRYSKGCKKNAPVVLEGVLKRVPSGPYRLDIIGSGKLITGNVAVPGKGHLPGAFFPPPEMQKTGSASES